MNCVSCKKSESLPERKLLRCKCCRQAWHKACLKASLRFEYDDHPPEFEFYCDRAKCQQKEHPTSLRGSTRSSTEDAVSVSTSDTKQPTSTCSVSCISTMAASHSQAPDKAPRFTGDGAYASTHRERDLSSVTSNAGSFTSVTPKKINPLFSSGPPPKVLAQSVSSTIAQKQRNQQPTPLQAEPLPSATLEEGDPLQASTVPYDHPSPATFHKEKASYEQNMESHASNLHSTSPHTTFEALRESIKNTATADSNNGAAQKASMSTTPQKDRIAKEQNHIMNKSPGLLRGIENKGLFTECTACHKSYFRSRTDNPLCKQCSIQRQHNEAKAHIPMTTGPARPINRDKLYPTRKEDKHLRQSKPKPKHYATASKPSARTSTAGYTPSLRTAQEQLSTPSTSRSKPEQPSARLGVAKKSAPSSKVHIDRSSSPSGAIARENNLAKSRSSSISHTTLPEAEVGTAWVQTQAGKTLSAFEPHQEGDKNPRLGSTAVLIPEITREVHPLSVRVSQQKDRAVDTTTEPVPVDAFSNELPKGATRDAAPAKAAPGTAPQVDTTTQSRSSSNPIRHAPHSVGYGANQGMVDTDNLAFISELAAQHPGSPEKNGKQETTATASLWDPDTVIGERTTMKTHPHGGFDPKSAITDKRLASALTEPAPAAVDMAASADHDIVPAKETRNVRTSFYNRLRKSSDEMPQSPQNSLLPNDDTNVDDKEDLSPSGPDAGFFPIAVGKSSASVLSDLKDVRSISEANRPVLRPTESSGAQSHNHNSKRRHKRRRDRTEIRDSETDSTSPEAIDLAGMDTYNAVPGPHRATKATNANSCAKSSGPTEAGGEPKQSKVRLKLNTTKKHGKKGIAVVLTDTSAGHKMVPAAMAIMVSPQVSQRPLNEHVSELKRRKFTLKLSDAQKPHAEAGASNDNSSGLSSAPSVAPDSPNPPDYTSEENPREDGCSIIGVPLASSGSPGITRSIGGQSRDVHMISTSESEGPEPIVRRINFRVQTATTEAEMAPGAELEAEEASVSISHLDSPEEDVEMFHDAPSQAESNDAASFELACSSDIIFTPPSPSMLIHHNSQQARAAAFDPSDLDFYLAAQANPRELSEFELAESLDWAEGHGDQGPRPFWPEQLFESKAHLEDKLAETLARGVGGRSRSKKQFGMHLKDDVRRERLEKGWSVHQSAERDAKNEIKAADFAKKVFGIDLDAEDSTQQVQRFLKGGGVVEKKKETRGRKKKVPVTFGDSH